MRIGVDIIDIERMEKAIKRTPNFLLRVFSQQELDYCMPKKNPYPSLAARFAAKEAFRKIDPIFTKGIRFHDVEVMINREGRPELLLHPSILEKAAGIGINQWDISLSHSHSQAIAAIIADKG
ncbi:Holo-[acyl carrier protein] synthase [Syntrophomonas zehnderi OL-4]|uniref:Holo-[acyl-carrier-protein] synthase n=1 Tax=Syntrophomonas zehnderi OL-4 TaxID=690567 RepID=A0A0E3W3K8_9FIRM|nr:holo-ACP synthase [Syntrophomonas zehnderi]CFX89899.1 Holo-[acyl carrier protein] synthase [Syntrophomonas zehnderi OL-4]